MKLIDELKWRLAQIRKAIAALERLRELRGNS